MNSKEEQDDLVAGKTMKACYQHGGTCIVFYRAEECPLCEMEARVEKLWEIIQQ